MIIIDPDVTQAEELLPYLAEGVYVVGHKAHNQVGQTIWCSATTPRVRGEPLRRVLQLDETSSPSVKKKKTILTFQMI